MEKGYFIAFEGPEGTGKTAQVRLVAEAVRARTGREVVVTREPGGSPLAEEIRGIILEGRAKAAGPLAELMLFNAARMAHLTETVMPALRGGAIVMTDRYWDSTMAYQCIPHGLEEAEAAMRAILMAGTGGLAKPDLFLSLHADAETRQSRRRARGTTDRFEAEDAAFHEAVASAYGGIAARSPDHHPVNAAQPLDAVTKDCVEIVLARLP